MFSFHTPADISHIHTMRCDIRQGVSSNHDASPERQIVAQRNNERTYEKAHFDAIALFHC